MNQKHSNEHRHFSRVPFHADVQLQFLLSQEMQTVRLLDISLKGALIETGEILPHVFNGKACRLVLALNKAGENITMEGKVAHHEGQLMGIECRNIDLDSISKLRRLLELNTCDDKLLERELSEILKIAGADTHKAPAPD